MSESVLLQRMTARERRTVKLGILTVTTIAGVGFGLPAWREWESATRASARERVTLVRHLEAAARELAATRDSAAARATRLGRLRAAALAAATSAGAGAALASVLSRLTDDAAVHVLAMNIRADSTGESPRRLAVQLSLVTDVDGLVRLLRALDDEELLLAVRELSIDGGESSLSTAVATAEPLHIELLVEALAFIAGPAPLVAITGSRVATR